MNGTVGELLFDLEVALDGSEEDRRDDKRG